LPDSQTAVGVDQYSGKTVTIDVHTGAPTTAQNGQIKGTEWIADFAWSPDGKQIATGEAHDVNARITVWEATTGAALYSLHSRDPNTYEGTFLVAWSPDGKVLATASEQVNLWNAETGSLIEKDVFGSKLHAHSLAFSPDGSMLAGVDIQHLMVLNMKTRAVQQISTGDWGIWLAWSPDGSRIALMHYTGQLDVIDAKTLTTTITIKPGENQEPNGYPTTFSAVAWSPDGKQIAISAKRQQIEIYDATSGSLIRSFGRLLYPDLTDIEGYYNDTSIASLAWSPDGTTLAAAYGTYPAAIGNGYVLLPPRPVILWNPRTGNRVRTLQGHSAEVQVVHFSPDGSKLASAGYDGVVYVWDLR